MENVTKEQAIAYAAGVFEGEGTIGYSTRRSEGGTSTRRALVIAMTDVDVLEKVQWAFDAGNINGPYYSTNKAGKSLKPRYVWAVGKWADVERIILLMWPYLGKRRREKALAVLSNPPTGRLYGTTANTCQKGHEWTPENTVGRPHGRRACRTCCNAHRRAKRAQEKDHV